MKYSILIGGTIAFLVTFAASLHAGNEVAFALRDGAVGCLVGGFLMRGFYYILVQSVQTRVQARAEELRQEREALDSSSKSS
jgi:hypothetical protein